MLEYNWGYDITHTCDYDQDGESDKCGIPAPYRMWWGITDNKAYFCEHHFKLHKAMAEKQEAEVKGNDGSVSM